MSELIVAIDGPAGSGKSSVSRLVARRLGLPHLDTGGFYRAATLVALRAGVDLSDEEAILAVLADVELTSTDGVMHVDGVPVEADIRGPLVTGAVSRVSAHRGVRRRLVDLQRAWVEQHGGNGVVEGRDIGTVVFPKASVKVFLTATPEERARRRAGERGEDPAHHLEAIRRRDAIDGGRRASPMKVAEDAVVIDTTSMPIEAVVDRILGMVPQD